MLNNTTTNTAAPRRGTAADFVRQSLRTRAAKAADFSETIDADTGVVALSWSEREPHAAVITLSGKPTVFRFLRAATRDEWVAREFAEAVNAAKARAARVEERRRARAEFATDLKPGDVLVASWGYDQTNVDFVEVVRVVGRQTVEIAPIAQKAVEQTGHMTEMVVAVPGKFTGEARRCRVSPHGYVKLASYKYAHRWDGKPQYQSSYA